jgi:hypothetical protein
MPLPLANISLQIQWPQANGVYRTRYQHSRLLETKHLPITGSIFTGLKLDSLHSFWHLKLEALAVGRIPSNKRIKHGRGLGDEGGLSRYILEIELFIGPLDASIGL